MQLVGALAGQAPVPPAMPATLEEVHVPVEDQLEESSLMIIDLEQINKNMRQNDQYFNHLG